MDMACAGNVFISHGLCKDPFMSPFNLLIKSFDLPAKPGAFKPARRRSQIAAQFYPRLRYKPRIFFVDELGRLIEEGYVKAITSKAIVFSLSSLDRT